MGILTNENETQKFVKEFVQHHGSYDGEQFNCEMDLLRRKLVDIQFEVEEGVIFLNAFNLNERFEKDARLPDDVKRCLAPYAIKQYAAVVKLRLLSQYLHGTPEGMLDSSQKERMNKVLADIDRDFGVAADKAKYMEAMLEK